MKQNNNTFYNLVASATVINCNYKYKNLFLVFEQNVEKVVRIAVKMIDKIQKLN